MEAPLPSSAGSTNPGRLISVTVVPSALTSFIVRSPTQVCDMLIWTVAEATLLSGNGGTTRLTQVMEGAVNAPVYASSWIAAASPGPAVMICVVSG